MKVVILAGGYGTRLAEETTRMPKPLVDIGGRPLIWHIMKHYGAHGFTEFVVALGYRGEAIKRYFTEYHRLSCDLTVRLGEGAVSARTATAENWVVHLVDTGEATLTGGRLWRLAPLLSDATFMLTYGDGLSDVRLDAVAAHHRMCGQLATVTAVRPPTRFGAIVFEGERVAAFTEKPAGGDGWINGGFMVLEPAVLSRLKGDRDVLETDLLEPLAREGQLAAYRHAGFWQCCDTVRDKQNLEALWSSGHAPWRTW
jgi:glucose-1-phosphate cytidylyltransferase